MNINEIFARIDELFENKQADKAEDYLLSCLNRAESEGRHDIIIPVCNELGGYYRATGRYEEGTPLYQKALQSLEMLNLANTEHHAVTLINYGTNYAVKGESEAALVIFSEAADIFKKLGFSEDYRLAALYNNMSIICQDTEDFDKAMDYLSKALDILNNLTDSETEIAVTYTNMAQILLNTGRFDEALSAVKKSIEIFDSVSGDSDVHYSGAIETLGRIQLAAGEIEKAAESWEYARKLTARDYGCESLAYKALSDAIDKLSRDETSDESSKDEISK